MLDLYAELRRIVLCLDSAAVPYALAGGLAVSKRLRGSAQDRADLEALGPEP